MRLMPRSLFGRLAALSAIATAAALVVAAFGIGAVLERFVMQGLDQQLDLQIGTLASAVQDDGQIDTSRAIVAAPYDNSESGWGWRIDAPKMVVVTPNPPDRGAPRHRERGHRRHWEDAAPPGPQPFDWRDAQGHFRHARAVVVQTSGGPVSITVSAPRAIVERPIRAAMMPLLGSLALLGLALLLATLVQLRLGLRPLATLRESLARVRAGQAEAVPIEQPAELKPLADELNALLAENAAALANARGHVANLAHGLKTPLAALALRLNEQGRDPDGAMAAEVARIDRSIRHHLGRARADASGGARQRTPLEAAVDGVAGALARIHADRAVTFTRSVPHGLALAIDPQDLDELLGNLLDNGWRWAASRITLTAEPHPSGRVRLAIEDDGPGIAAADRAEALRPGRRLDESGDGHGFGLSIVRELAELHGGTLALEAAPSGGLRAIVTLPMAAPGQS
jgi:signal transduction histidine kinase